MMALCQFILPTSITQQAVPEKSFLLFSEGPNGPEVLLPNYQTEHILETCPQSPPSGDIEGKVRKQGQGWVKGYVALYSG